MIEVKSVLQLMLFITLFFGFLGLDVGEYRAKKRDLDVYEVVTTETVRTVGR